MEIVSKIQPEESPKKRAVAYYRHSGREQQEKTVEIQKHQVREWAQEHDIDIVQEFTDCGKPGLTAESRPAFIEMMEEWVKNRKDFDYILCVDPSRLGRLQDIELPEKICAECTKNGKQVNYTSYFRVASSE